VGDAGNADLVLVGGDVYTVDAVGRWANAIAVRDGRIVAVGTNDEIRGWTGRRTETIDVGGKMVLPGFQDAHIHAPAGGLNRLRCDLSEVHTLDQYRTIISSYAETHPEMPWITGGGWGMDLFPGGTPGRDVLDAIVPDRPVFLSNRDNHAVWVNSPALALAGVDATTPDPPDGRIERDAAGAAQGTLHEGAMSLVRRVVPDPGPDELERAILLAQTYLHSLGITAWQDAIVGEYPSMPNARDAYPALARRGLLTARVVGALWWDRKRGEEQIEELIDARRRTSAGRYRATSVKIMQDGVCENLTARLLEPYLDGSGAMTANLGLAYVDPELLPGIVTRLDAEGFQIHGHAIGDGAVRAMLDATEAARGANGVRDNRHHLAHIQVVHPDDIPRFRGLGVVANGQPLWAANDPQMTELTLPFLGPQRASWQYPFGSLVRDGAILAFGSDWPVSTPDVLQEIHVAVNRTSPPGYVYGVAPEQTPFLPEQRITLAQAIRAFTMGSAYVNHNDAETGSIEAGKLADLVVVSENLFALDPAAMGEARVVLTMVDGRPVYEAPGL
jgi:predicted amidohydrolase YtcJ